jgi:hypothetical protein
MKVCVIGNVSDTRCGISNYSQQTAIALARHGHDVTVWDGTYSVVYQRQQEGDWHLGMFPHDLPNYDVVHLCWHALTLNHYSGAPWAELAHLPGGGPLRSWVDGGPSNASCPFRDWMQVLWGHYESEERRALGYHMTPLPIPDWITDLPAPDLVFTVGATSVRGDGIAEIRQVCEQHGWALNLPRPEWLTLEEEVRRLARSTVNVCWYDTPPIWRDWAGAPSTALASRRPLLISRDSILQPLWDRSDLYHGAQIKFAGAGLNAHLWAIHRDWQLGDLRMPSQVLRDLSWSTVAAEFTRVWKEALDARAA